MMEQQWQQPLPLDDRDYQWGNAECTVLEECTWQQAAAAKSSGCKRGGRPVTWIGGGGMDPKQLAGLGVPALRTLFGQVFGQETASNNAGWLRRKLAEAPDSVHGQRRSPVVRARDQGAAIWNHGGAAQPCDPQHDHHDHHDHHQQQQQQVQGELDRASEGPPAQLPAQQQQQHQQHLPDAAGYQQQQLELQQLPCGMRRGSEGVGSAEGSMSPPARTPPSSPAGASCADGCPTALLLDHGSPSSLGKRSHAGNSKRSQDGLNYSAYVQQQQQQQQGPSCVSGVPIQKSSMSAGGYCGRRVLVYWPADKRWWDAVICQFNMQHRHMQLLYADMTEECVAGKDFDDLLANGHLLDVEGPTSSVAVGSQASQQQLLELDRALSAPAQQTTSSFQAAGSHSGHQDSLSGLSGPGHDASNTWRCAFPDRSQSCLLPISSSTPAGMQAAAANPSGVPAADRGTSLSVQQGSQHSTYITGYHSSLTNSAGGSGSGSGSGSGNDEPDVQQLLLAKRPRFESSTGTTLCGSLGGEAPSTSAQAFAEASATAAAPVIKTEAPSQQQQQQLQQVQPVQQIKQQQSADPAQLGLWFANQQLQQLQIQQQVRQNLELQQQAHLQMQQMAAQMQMQRAVGQSMLQQQMLTPFGVSVPVAAAGMMSVPPVMAVAVSGGMANACSTGFTTPQPVLAAVAPIAAVMHPAEPVVPQATATTSPGLGQGAAPAAATATADVFSLELQQLQQHQQELKVAPVNQAGPGSPAAAAFGPQMVTAIEVPAPSTCCSPAAVAVATTAMEPVQQLPQEAPLEELRLGTPALLDISCDTDGCLSGFSRGMQGNEAPDEVDTLLSQPDEGLFDLDAAWADCACNGPDSCGCGQLDMSEAERAALMGDDGGEESERMMSSLRASMGPSSSSCSLGSASGNMDVSPEELQGVPEVAQPFPGSTGVVGGAGVAGMSCSMAFDGNGNQAGSGAGKAGMAVPEVAGENFMLAHVFDYA